MTNIASECRIANIVRDHAMILLDQANPKPDGIYGNHSPGMNLTRDRLPQLTSSAYRAAVEQEIRKRGYSIESMLRAADPATTWDKDEAWDMVRAALERQHPKSSS